MAEESVEDEIRSLQQMLEERPTEEVFEVLLSIFTYPELEKDPRRLSYVVALIEFDPSSRLHTSPQASVDPETNPEKYREGVELWEDHLQKERTSAVVVGAASFFARSDRQRALKVLRSFEPTSPGDPAVYLTISRITEDSMQRLEYLEKAAEAGASFANLALQKALAAAEAGALDKAQRYAEALFEGASWTVFADDGTAHTRFLVDAQRRWHHLWGHTVLGFVAARRADLEAALAHMHRSIDVEPDFRMESRGPPAC